MGKRREKPTRASKPSAELSDDDLERAVGGVQDISELSGDELMATFMKLNVNDPNMDPDTHKKLLDLSKEVTKNAATRSGKRP
jgi:hypothetical protein